MTEILTAILVADAVLAIVAWKRKAFSREN